jgi:predicted lipoprotein with Yx(FWY)xxD motif
VKVRAIMKFLTPSLAAALLLSACGGSSSKKETSSAATSSSPATTQASSGSSALVKTAVSSRTGGTVLVNAQGMTLYRLSAESAGKFICTGTCLQVWHPLKVPAGSTPSGSVGSLGMVKRPDGSEQVTYKGGPLYTFAQDTKQGDENGQGVKDVGTWSVVTVTSSSGGGSEAPATSTKTSSGGYGY